MQSLSLHFNRRLQSVSLLAGAGGETNGVCFGEETSSVGSEQLPRQTLENLLEQVTDGQRDMAAEWNRAKQELELIAVDLAFAVSSRLLHREIDQGQMALSELVRSMLEEFQPSQAQAIRMHPEDLAQFEKMLAQENPDWVQSAGVSLRADAELHRGNCRIEASDNGLLFDWKSQLTQMRYELLQTLHDDEH